MLLAVSHIEKHATEHMQSRIPKENALQKQAGNMKFIEVVVMATDKIDSEKVLSRGHVSS